MPYIPDSWCICGYQNTKILSYSQEYCYFPSKNDRIKFIKNVINTIKNNCNNENGFNSSNDDWFKKILFQKNDLIQLTNKNKNNYYKLHLEILYKIDCYCFHKYFMVDVKLYLNNYKFPKHIRLFIYYLSIIMAIMAIMAIIYMTYVIYWNDYRIYKNAKDNLIKLQNDYNIEKTKYEKKFNEIKTNYEFYINQYQKIIDLYELSIK